MRWWKRRAGAEEGAGGRNGQGVPVTVTDTGDAHAADGSTAVTGFRSTAVEPAAGGQVSDTGDANAAAGSIANTGHFHIDGQFSGTAHTVVQAAVINRLTIAGTAAVPLPMPHRLPPRVAGFRNREAALSSLNVKLERRRVDE
ncbi:hypothetical protein ACFYXV_31360 [Streptomyces sp. NPDC002181]|uniref:hypothetical protein n=1 Tax=Streptomyces sp. NPDC002181 TaxID=3364635 RepID=UPI00368D2392